jgi:hypothetical protein
MRKLKFENFFAADKQWGIRANVLYSESRIGKIGVFYGYEGGGAYSDGYFWIDNTDDLSIANDIAEFPEEVRETLRLLWSEKSKYEDHDSIEGVPSEFAMAQKSKKNTVIAGDHWVFCSPGCSRRVINYLSQKWALSVRW